MAVRLAAILPLSDARIGVMVVPMLPPKIMAQPNVNDIQPCEHIISVMANVAAELCAIMVNTMPRPKNISTDHTPRLVHSVTNFSISGFSCRLGTYSEIMSRPMNSSEKPIRNSPNDLYALFFMNSIGTPMARSTRE